MTRWELIVLYALLLSGCAAVSAVHNNTSETSSLRWMKDLVEKKAGESQQVLIIASDNPSSSVAVVYPFSRLRGQWDLVFKPINAVIGRNGFALPGEKREGDGKTPSGIYPLEFAFGYATTILTKMAYRQATEKDVWVDDANSIDYNTWARKGETIAASYEEMRRRDNLYKIGIVIGYNTSPVVKGSGSAIFFHVWTGPGTPTAGCIAMAEADLMAILDWLDPSQKPLVVMGTPDTLK
jgi:L,D-peptidoglycan transpeptidase YkuD (ErfK/YbiS/YcfS/YnhG family)